MLRRNVRRWIIEGTNSRLNTLWRRLTTLREQSLAAFLGFLQVAIIIICQRTY